jgi:hypothetical protein
MVKVYIEAEPNLMSNEYDIENNCVKYSNSEHWREEYRGKIVMKAVDDGNNITIQRANDSNIKLSYSEAYELLIMLLHINDSRIEFREETITKTINNAK